MGGVFGTGVFRYDETDTVVEHNLRRDLTIRDDDPLSARYVLTQLYRLQRPGQAVIIRLVNEMTSDQERFHLNASLTIEDEGQPVFERRFAEDIPRTFL